MSKYVPGFGSSSARLMVIGEAPGANEEDTGRPFSGPSGNLLDEAFLWAGFGRDYTYMTNVVKVRPPNNEIEKLNLIGHTIEEFLPQLWEEIRVIDPNCILAIGNTALTALTGFKGIQHYRGSILTTSSGTKVVPTIHPAALLHGEAAWKEFAWIKADVKRAYEQSQFKDYRPPSRNLHIANNSLDVIRFLERHTLSDTVTLDVETFKTWAQCIGLAFSQHEAISIPTFVDTIPLHDRVYIWKILAEFLADTKIKIIAQNAKFDQKRCRQLGLLWHDCWFSMDMGWHVLFPEFPKKLEFIASMITEEPYYKDEGKEYNPKIHKIDRWLLYNAKDAAVEYECALKILNELREAGLEEFFFDKIQPLYSLYYDIEDTGILIDLEIRKHLGKKYNDLRAEKQETLVKNIANNDPVLFEHYKNFNVMSNGPKNQVAKLLFGHLKLPVRKDTGDDTLKSLANNVVKDQRIKDILLGILDVRKVRKTIGTYIEAELSTNKRIHTQCNLNGAESGRTSTGILKPPVSIEKEGIALQTMTKHEDINLSSGGADLRSMFIADPDYTLVEADGSQAEDRVVCVLATDWDALKAYERTEFKINKYGLKDDRHTQTTMDVCSMPFEDITDWYRQIGKKTRHAGNYRMQKHTHMLQLGKAGIYISEWQAGKQLERFHAANTKIKGVFHEEIVDCLWRNNNILFSPHGRRRIFFNKWGEELFKEAYAQIPQATVTDQTKFAMKRTTKRLSKYYKKYFWFCLESHDSSLALVLDSLVPEYNAVMKEEMEKPISFERCSLQRKYELVIPCEIKTGKRWIEKSVEFPDGMCKYKG